MSTIQDLAMGIAYFGDSAVGISETTCALCVVFTVITLMSFWRRYTTFYKLLLAFMILQCGEYLILNNLWDRQVGSGLIRIDSLDNAIWRFYETMYFSLILVLMSLYTELVNFKNTCMLEVALRRKDIKLMSAYEGLTPKGWERGVFRTIETMSCVIYFGSWFLLFTLQKGLA